MRWAAVMLGMLVACGGCARHLDRAVAPDPDWSLDDPAAHVLPLGNLITGAPPTAGQVALAEFLFGAAPEPALTLIKPIALAVQNGELRVSDGALRAVLCCASSPSGLTAAPLADPPLLPTTICVGALGELLVVDAEANDVKRYASSGALLRRLRPADGPFRPSGAAFVGDEVWVSNAAAHRVDVFDASGAHARSIGQRGRGRGEFGLPLALAVLPDGDVAVVDMLAARVQVLGRDGIWQREIGGPGDRIGRFGRPKSIAVGPDGVVFVVDAASQRVHAFAADGRPLLSFGDASDGPRALVIPAGITIVTATPTAQRALPSGFPPDYYVLVAEQMADPGVRVYAWRGPRELPRVAPAVAAARRPAQRPAPTVENPHWRADGCRTCHGGDGAAPRPIARERVDALCVSCHDGRRAIDDAHPIGWPAAGPRTHAPPDDWPLVDGRIGCLTCHDIQRHCAAAAVRPAENPALVRGFDARDPFASCTNCHAADAWRVNPHRMVVAPSGHDGASGAGDTPRQSCGFCHQSTPPTPADGVARGDARLRDTTSKLCLGCHTMHADPAPRGHLEAHVTPSILGTLLAAEQRIFAARGWPRPADAPASQPVLLPLSDGRVNCATCHNPHAPELFGSESPLGSRSTAPADAHKALRVEHLQLCFQCHLDLPRP
ncbi:MAG: cytochrome c3 family protein [Phycisphaerae bacterium]